MATIKVKPEVVTSALEQKMKEQEIKANDQRLVMEKINTLRELLAAIRPGERIEGLDGTNWAPCIHDDHYLQVIEKKILSLVQKL